MNKSNIELLLELGDILNSRNLPHQLSSGYFEREELDLEKVRSDAKALANSLRMSQDTFERRFDL